VEGDIPEGRVGHRFVAVGDKLYLIGGGVWSEKHGWSTQYYQMYVFDTVTKRWYLPLSEMSSTANSSSSNNNNRTTNNNIGTSPINATAIPINNNNNNTAANAGNGNSSNNSEPVNDSSVNPHPPPVCYPFSFAYKEFLVTTTLAEKKMWFFDTIAERWYEIVMYGETGETDIPTSAHSMGAVGVVGNQAFFLGSYHIGPGSSLNDFYRVSFGF